MYNVSPCSKSFVYLNSFNLHNITLNDELINTYYYKCHHTDKSTLTQS